MSLCRYLLEDGSGYYLLEDGSGYYALNPRDCRPVATSTCTSTIVLCQETGPAISSFDSGSPDLTKTGCATPVVLCQEIGAAISGYSAESEEE